jgi:hypothetical protein
MAENDDLKIDGDIATWEMRLEGDVSGTYVGIFKFRCYLTPLQTIAQGREYRELLGANIALAPEHETFLAYALTQLKQRIVSAPPFWTSAGVNKTHEGDIADENVIEKILDAAIRAEVKYREEKKRKKAEALERANKAMEVLQEDKSKAKPKEEEIDPAQ